MKVPISQSALIDLDASVLPAYEISIKGATKWIEHCGQWHQHGPAEGHREAHCEDSGSPYWKRRYNLAFAGKWKDRNPQ